MGPLLETVADRSPRGRLRIAGGALRVRVNANWKIYLENINDTVHPVSAHESAAQAATAVWAGHDPDEPKPMSMQQMLPFGSGYAFFEAMGGRVLPQGHSVLGTRFSIHTQYAGLEDYERALREAHGDARAREVLGFAPQNAVFYPSLALKGAPTLMRVLRPIAPDRTILEAWAFQPEGAPASLLQRAAMLQPAGVLDLLGGRA
jgi:phenylpropionate dioxygenase-like ring-hydroxylating dioxygenase large terminal subunit